MHGPYLRRIGQHIAYRLLGILLQGRRQIPYVTGGRILPYRIGGLSYSRVPLFSSAQQSFYAVGRGDDLLACLCNIKMPDKAAAGRHSAALKSAGKGVYRYLFYNIHSGLFSASSRVNPSSSI